ncbi:hypothetical protein KUTeg_024499 [Tegillarca granosa]|uniref:VWFD domain-containing protein n=1 Tax=Tegillarca granosa TaxID=220873 RepID=A0ABQ9DXI1_TEGGR|nr:hypothetical protein KUTeg_024499 [Tegillarca granosa]
MEPFLNNVYFLSVFSAIVYGQGHINTLDNAKFRMCSKGDYTLLKGPDFTIQGRFQNSAANGSFNNMTVILTNIAVKTRSETIEIRLRHPSVDRSKRYLDVLVNNTYQTFDNKEMFWQDYKGNGLKPQHIVYI